MTILINDETSSGEILNQIMVELNQTDITLETLIKERIKAEVRAFGEAKTEDYIFQRQKESCFKALNMFREHGFCIFINHKRIDDLQIAIPTKSIKSIRFVRLCERQQTGQAS